MPEASRDEKTLAALSANVSANLLGLGNAATPLGHPGGPADGPGLRRHRQRRAVPAGGAEHRLHPALLPATIASVRGASGAESPFDILPAVWLASALSVSVGILTAKCLAALGRWRR